MKYVHVSSKVDRRLKDLKSTGKAGKALAQKAAFVIESLTSGAVCSHRDATGSYTRYGEKRIRNCRKYDLGCGYRLVTLQQGDTLFVLFLGTHDECQRWLENNSRLKEVVAGNGVLFRIPQESRQSESSTNVDSVDFEEDTDDELQLKLSNKDLRRVFCGLVKGAKKRRQKLQGHTVQCTRYQKEVGKGDEIHICMPDAKQGL